MALSVYIPGRVLLMYESRSALGAAVGDESSKEEKHDGGPSEEYYRIDTDGSAAVLRFFEIDAFHLVTDHATSSYYGTLAKVGSSVEESRSLSS